jgi:hypothetical protein
LGPLGSVGPIGPQLGWRGSAELSRAERRAPRWSRTKRIRGQLTWSCAEPPEAVGLRWLHWAFRTGRPQLSWAEQGDLRRAGQNRVHRCAGNCAEQSCSGTEQGRAGQQSAGVAPEQSRSQHTNVPPELFSGWASEQMVDNFPQVFVVCCLLVSFLGLSSQLS